MKVYVIEDNPVYNDYVCNLLKKSGFDTVKAHHLGEAKKMLAQIGDDDIVLADLRLAEGESIELLRWMRATGKEQPFIVMTDYGEVHSAVESMKLGSEDYIQKPLLADKLVPLICSIQKRREKQAHRIVPIFTRQGTAYQNIKKRVRLVADPDERADTRRERHGQGTHRPPYPCPKQTVKQTIRGGGLRHVIARTGTLRLLRSRQGSIYRSGLSPRGVFSGSRGRHAVPR